MSIAPVRIGKTLARLYRVSFSGELGYELAVPAGYGAWLFGRLLDIGPLRAMPYGTQALGVLRLEKGYLGAAEINGQTLPADLGLTRFMAKDKPFVGKDMAARLARGGDRLQLIGLKPLDRGAQLMAGAHLLPLAGRSRTAEAAGQDTEGYLSSAAFSPTLGHAIGLGFVRRGFQRHGERLLAADPLRGQEALVEIVPPVFYDPEGMRLHG
jgi:sarcosine oxidase subunit alpha